MRAVGTKNKRPSRRDITKVSLATLAEAIYVFKKMLDKDKLTEEQKIELTRLYEQMEAVIKSGSKHLSKGYNL